MTRRALYIVALAVIATSQLAARDAVNVTSCINNDTLSTIKIIEPAALSLRVAREGETLQYQGISDLVAEEDAHSDQSNQSTNRVAGYRVQVFSDNNQRTAKSEARSKETKIKEAFPDLGTYIVYNSPFWRLKVGDFKTQIEAESVADEIKSRFPSFAREVRVIRDRVNSRR